MLTPDQADDLKKALQVWKNSVAQLDVRGKYADRISDLEKVIDKETDRSIIPDLSHSTELYIHGRCHISSPLEASVKNNLLTIVCFHCKKLIVRFKVEAK